MLLPRDFALPPVRLNYSLTCQAGLAYPIRGELNYSSWSRLTGLLRREQTGPSFSISAVVFTEGTLGSAAASFLLLLSSAENFWFRMSG